MLVVVVFVFKTLVGVVFMVVVSVDVVSVVDVCFIKCLQYNYKSKTLL